MDCLGWILSASVDSTNHFSSAQTKNELGFSMTSPGLDLPLKTSMKA
jgi:hypothetical protein